MRKLTQKQREELSEMIDISRSMSKYADKNVSIIECVQKYLDGIEKKEKRLLR